MVHVIPLLGEPFEWMFQLLNIKLKNLRKLYLWIFLVQTKTEFLVQGCSATENTDIHLPVPEIQVLLLSATTLRHRGEDREGYMWVGGCVFVG